MARSHKWLGLLLVSLVIGGFGIAAQPAVEERIVLLPSAAADDGCVFVDPETGRVYVDPEYCTD